MSENTEPASTGAGNQYEEEDRLREIWFKTAARLDRYPNSPKAIKAQKDAWDAYMAVYEANIERMRA